MTDAARLERFVAGALKHYGVPDSEARTVAKCMVEADLLGQETHGVFRLRQYLLRLKDGGCNPKPNIKIIAERAAIALIDGDDGLGHLAMRRATDVAIAKAKEAGIGWVGVRRGNHAGPAALYVRPQAEASMIGLAAAVGSANHVPPFGGTDLLLGTNPIALSAPTDGDDPFVLDMATTVAAMGKIKTLAQRGEAMPEGWMVGKDGKPLTDPNQRTDGFMLPIGAPKGFGLSVGIGLLAGVLNGAAFGSDVIDFTSQSAESSNTGQFVAAIDIEAFSSLERFKAAAGQAFAEMRASEPLPGHDPVRLPGDGKTKMMAERIEGGIDLHPALVRELNAIAAELGIETL